MIDQIITAALGTLILGAAYLIDLVVGVAKVSFTPDLKWSWAKMGKDLVKALLIAIGIVGFTAVLNALTWYGTKTGADLSFLSAISFPALVAGILGGSAWYLGNTLKNILAFINSRGVEVKVDESKADYAGIRKTTLDILEFIVPQADPTVAQAHLDYELQGGVGARYSVDISSYDAFKAAVLTHGYNIDDAYGWQCWDGAALLWQQLGLNLVTGNGLAIGCWDLKRDVNKYDKFDLITNADDLKPGDVVVMRPNHIGFFDGWNGNYMRILGQNQGGQPTITQGGYTTGAFNITNVARSAFAGAFRLKTWNVAPAPQPAPAPTPAPAQDLTAVVAAVRRGDYGNNPERAEKLKAEGYDPAVVQAAVNAQIAAEARDQQAQAPTPAAPSAIAVGDSVVAWGRGTAASDGSGDQTVAFPETTMKVIRIVNGRLALNQYNQGEPEDVAAVTGWWPTDQVRKA